MWDQLACMNIAVRTVMRSCPAETCAGTIAQRSMNASPLTSSMMKTMKLIAMIVA